MHRLIKKYLVVASFGLLAIALALYYFFSSSSQPKVTPPIRHTDSGESKRLAAIGESATSTISKQLDSRSHAENQVVKTENLNWAKLTVNDSLNSIFDAALKSNDPDDRNVLIQIGSICTSTLKNKVTIEDMDFRNENHINKKNVLAEIELARSKLQDFCKSGDTNAAFAEWQKQGIKSSPLYKTILRGSPDNTSAEYYHALTQVLSNPEKFALYFDLWVERDIKRIVLREIDATPGQVVFIQDELTRRLTSGTDSESVRLVNRCATQFVCRSSVSLNSEQQQKAMDVADILANLIRRQQWDQLLQR